MQKIYRIKLTPGERLELEQLTRSSKKIAGKKATQARALLLADESDLGAALSDPDFITATGIASATLSRLRQRTCEVGPLEALHRKPQEFPSRPRRLTGDVEACACAIACSEPPAGHKHWTLRLIANELVELEVLDSVSHEAVRPEGLGRTHTRTSKRTTPRPWRACRCGAFATRDDKSIQPPIPPPFTHSSGKKTDPCRVLSRAPSP